MKQSVKPGSQESFLEKVLRRTFMLGVIVKGIDGVLETVGGLAFLFIPTGALSHWILLLTRQQLLEDPDDWLAKTLRHAFLNLSAGKKLFAGLYLLIHGIIKIGLVWSLLRGKLWAYPISIVILIGFIGYQSFRLLNRFSPGVLVLTLLDVVITLLIWHQYRFLKKHGRP